MTDVYAPVLDARTKPFPAVSDTGPSVVTKRPSDSITMLPIVAVALIDFPIPPA